MSQKLGFRPDEAAEVLGSVELLERCRAAGWIEPTVQQKKLTLFDYSDLCKCWSRLRKGERPPLRRQPAKK